MANLRVIFSSVLLVLATPANSGEHAVSEDMISEFFQRLGRLVEAKALKEPDGALGVNGVLFGAWLVDQDFSESQYASVDTEIGEPVSFDEFVTFGNEIFCALSRQEIGAFDDNSVKAEPLNENKGCETYQRFTAEDILNALE